MLGFLLSVLTVVHFPSPSGTRIVDIKAEPEAGWQVNLDAPWKIDISDEQNTKIATKEFKPALPGFVLETQTSTPSGQFAYRMTSFFCKADKSECKRQVFTGVVKFP